jgi:D-lactate dehydrogenase (cytochrome)
MTTIDLEACLDDLRAALAPDRVQTGEDIRRLHGTDSSFHTPVLPDAVVFPETAEEAAAVVRTCVRHDVPMVPFGAGSSMEGHIHALRGGVSIDMSRMDAILRLSVEDLDVTVQAGVTRRQLDAKLRPEGVFFPVDPGADATIGGMVATGASGTTTVRYGAMRENVLSLLVVTAEGELVRTRSRARKSSAGYDLTRLFIGSEGTLGLVVEVTLRVQPTPEAMVAATCPFGALADAVAAVTEVASYGIAVARIELVDELSIAMINAHFELALPVAPTLFFEFHGSPEETAAQAAAVQEIVAGHGATAWEAAAGEAERRRLWHARHGAYEATRATQPGCEVLTTDVCVPVSELAESVLEAQADIAEHGLKASIVGHVGDGNFHVAVVLDPDRPEQLEEAERFHERVVRRALARQGTCTGEHGVGYGKSRFVLEEHGEGGVALMRAVKDALDPKGLFNPGKVLPPA